MGDNESSTGNKNRSTGQQKSGNSKRIFPDWKTKKDIAGRNRVDVRGKAGTPKMQVHLKAFGVVDPSEETDINPSDLAGWESVYG